MLEELKAQSGVKVVEKKIEKQIKLTENERIKIVAQKADIKIHGWENDELKVILKFTATHSDKSIAEKELSYMKYKFFKEDDYVEIQNNFLIPKEVTKINSSVTVNYELWIPERNKTNISNSYGDVSFENLSGETDIKLEFGNINMENVSGGGHINIIYGDIIGSKIKGTWNCVSNKSNIELEEISGKYFFHSTYGKINILKSGELKGLEVDASRTAVSIRVGKLPSYSFNLSTSHSDIITSDDLDKNKINRNGRGIVSLKHIPSSSNALIKVNTSYSPIIIKNN